MYISQHMRSLFQPDASLERKEYGIMRIGLSSYSLQRMEVRLYIAAMVSLSDEKPGTLKHSSTEDEELHQAIARTLQEG